MFGQFDEQLVSLDSLLQRRRFAGRDVADLVAPIAPGLVIVVSASAQSGGSYVIDWGTIDAGGGVSVGGSYILRGTIGQPDAAVSAGGSYELLGGFWPGGPLCKVDFESFAIFAEYWLETGTGLPADLYEDEYNIVDYFDLAMLVDEWLCNCPYGWSLR